MMRTRQCCEPIKIVIKGDTRMGMSASSLALAERIGAQLDKSAATFSLSSALEKLMRPCCCGKLLMDETGVIGEGGIPVCKSPKGVNADVR